MEPGSGCLGGADQEVPTPAPVVLAQPPRRQGGRQLLDCEFARPVLRDAFTIPQGPYLKCAPGSWRVELPNGAGTGRMEDALGEGGRADS